MHPEVERPPLRLRIARAAGELVEQRVQPLVEVLELLGGQLQPQPAAQQVPLPHLGDLLEEGGQHGVAVGRRPVVDVHQPALAGGPVGHLPGAARAAAHRLRDQEAGVDQRAHVVQHRGGVAAQPLGEFLVRERLGRAQPEDAQAQRGSDRPVLGVGRLALRPADPRDVVLAHVGSLGDTPPTD